MKKKTLILITLILTLFTTSCSSLSKSSSDNPEVKKLLISLSTNYFENIMQKKYAVIDANIIWYNYIRNNGINFSKKKYYQQLVGFNTKYVGKNHPLNSVKFLDADIKGNNATIYFTNSTFNKKIEVDYTWSGSAWFIVDDNLFADGLMQ